MPNGAALKHTDDLLPLIDMVSQKPCHLEAACCPISRQADWEHSLSRKDLVFGYARVCFCLCACFCLQCDFRICVPVPVPVSWSKFKPSPHAKYVLDSEKHNY